MYGNKEVGNNESNISDQYIVVDNTVMDDDKNTNDDTLISNTPFFYIQILICSLIVLIILFNKYGSNNQSLNKRIVKEITYNTTKVDVEEFIRHIFEY